MVKIYIVTSGDYSSYGIDAVFSKKGKADEYCKNFKCDEVEEYELDPNTIPIDMITVEMARDGTVNNVKQLISRINTSGFWYFGALDDLIWHVKTNDEIRAIKVVNEKRIQILANDCWGDDERTKVLFNQHG